jgi:hypothetical protein
VLLALRHELLGCMFVMPLGYVLEHATAMAAVINPATMRDAMVMTAS